MAELTDDRPLFFLVMGCNGAGKTARKRGNYDSLPKHYYDLDSWAGGIGDWDAPDIRDRVLREFEAALEDTLSGVSPSVARASIPDAEARISSSASARRERRLPKASQCRRSQIDNHPQIAQHPR